MRESSSSGSDDDPRAAGQAQQPGPLDEASEESAYDWYTRGLRLLEARSAAAAEQLLTRAAAAEPESRSILEALGRAQFEAGRYNSARESFAKIIEVNPADDYAHFALGLSAARTGDLRTAVEHLALAAAMRPELPHYGRELRMARARQEGAS